MNTGANAAAERTRFTQTIHAQPLGLLLLGRKAAVPLGGRRAVAAGLARGRLVGVLVTALRIQHVV